ncbi:hypothetical protein BVX93_00255 [bacterium B13(2017)]|nr:hypothetical protein BVX93_00255 [bacterium B13(2017)]
MKSDERRKHPRFSFNCKIKKQKETDLTWHEGKMKDISFRGMNFVSKVHYNKKDVLTVEIHDKDLNIVPSTFSVIVMWSRKSKLEKDLYITGVKYKEFSKDRQEYLYRVISDCMSINKKRQP